jgi:hypothetical protein
MQQDRAGQALYIYIYTVEHCLHWLHLAPTHPLYYTGYTWRLLTHCTTLATLGAQSPTVLLHWLHLEPTHPLHYTGYT